MNVGRKTLRKYAINDFDLKALITSILFFLATSVFSLFYPNSGDSAGHLIRAKFILENGTLPFLQPSFNQARAYVYEPLFHILGAFTKFLTGYYQFLPAFMGAITIYISYKLFSLWYDEKTGFYAALALAINPFFFLFSSMMNVGTTIAAFFIITFYFYFKWLEYGKRNLIYLFAMFGGLSALIKTYGPLSLIIISIHYAIVERKYHVERNIRTIFKDIKTFVGPGIISGFLVFLWPIRNMIRVGNLLPRSFGGPLDWPEPVKNVDYVEGVEIIFPKLIEYKWFFGQALGVMPMGIINELSRFHHALPELWLILPLTLLGFVAYGGLEERNKNFVWIWLGSLVTVYMLQRYMSGGATSWKFRHFVTFTPVIALFTYRGYENVSISLTWKKTAAALLVAGLFTQMFVVAVINFQFTVLVWSPVDKWAKENLKSGDVVYADRFNRPIAYRFRHYDVRVITNSPKQGHIHFDKPLDEQLRKKADWLILHQDSPKLNQIKSSRHFKQVKEIDAYEDYLYGRMGRRWYIYQVTT